MHTLELRINEFAKFMDRNFPNWEFALNPDELDLASDKNCVLGQLYGSFKKGCKELKLTLDQAIAFGFHTPTEPGTDSNQYYAAARRAWVRETESRMPAFV